MVVKAKSSLLGKFEDLISSPVVSNQVTPRKILIVGPEVSPYANVGGVSRVLAFLSSALIKRGHDVRIFMPKFGSIDEKEYEMEVVHRGLEVPTDNPDKPKLLCNVKRHQIPGRAPVYFLENREYYELRANVYGYTDDSVRWALLSRGAIEFVKCCSDWVPDIIHANDWQTGLVPNYMKTVDSDNDTVEKIASIYTIHNLMYQGMFDHHMVSDLDFDDGKSPVVDFFNDRLVKQNFMRRGIMYADQINTVSPTYAREILRPEFGEGLDRLLTEVRSKLSGVLNGIDYDEYNPASDKLIPTNFDIYSLEKRVKNKEALQKEFDLKQDTNIPIVGFVGRLAGYKGLDLLLELLRPLMRDFQVQFVMVGGADGSISQQIQELQKEYPDMIGAHMMFDTTLPKLVFSGVDIIAMPSRFEPCGLPQMEGMRYGAVPLVHYTGGLADSVEDYDPVNETGNGFVFRNYDAWSLFAQIVRALETYRNKPVWRDLQKRGMQIDNSWDARASEYESLYERAIQVNTIRLKREGKIASSDT